MLHVLCQTSNYAQRPSYDFKALRKHRAQRVVKNTEARQQTCKMWQTLIAEILEVRGMNLEILAQDLEVFLDTLRRISKGETAYPRAHLARGLFVMHMIYRPDRYGQTPLDREWLREQGCVSYL